MPRRIPEVAQTPLVGFLVVPWEGYVTANSVLALEASAINDARYIDDAAREERLVKLFAEHGHTLRFVDTDGDV